MKYIAGLVLLSALLVLAYAAPSSRAAQTPLPDPAQDRVQQLETQLAATNAQVGALTREVAETRALLAKTLEYLSRQSSGASDLSAVLDEAEANGFAVGENFKSRQILLAGWRAALVAQQENVPQATTPAVPTKPVPAKPLTPPKSTPAKPDQPAGK